MMTQANNRSKKSAAKSAQHTADPAAVAAATRLREANVMVNLKSPEEAQETRCDTDRDATHPLRFSIPLNMSLVDRLIRMPLVAGPIKGSYNTTRDYVLASVEDIGIRHRSDDAHRVLLDFPLQTAACRPDFPCFVLWALSGILPAIYARLIGESFGPSHEVARRQLKELPAPIPYDDTEPPFEFRHAQPDGHDDRSKSQQPCDPRACQSGVCQCCGTGAGHRTLGHTQR